MPGTNETKTEQVGGRGISRTPTATGTYRNIAIHHANEAIAQLQMGEWGDISLEAAIESLSYAIEQVKAARVALMQEVSR